MSITMEQMRPKLHTLDHVHTVLGRTEPMQARVFSVGDPGLKFSATPGWNHGVKAKDGNDPVDVFVSLDSGGKTREFQMTKSTLEETCLAFGLPRNYATNLPSELLVPQMNYFFREGLLDAPKSKRDFQYMVNGDTAVAFTKASLTPFSNLSLLEQAVAGIQQKYGPSVEILADYKLSHTLRQTYLRLIIPDTYRVIDDTDTPDDIWSLGISLKNSLTGSSQTAIEGYLFRWTCTNGQIDTRAASGVWTRRKDATEAEVYQWARQAVNEALSGLDGAFDAVASLTRIGIDGSLGDTIRDVFEHYRIGIHQRPKIIRILEEHDGEITMYVIMNAITQVANDSSLEPSTVDALLRAGGDLPHTGEQRCGACHRLMHHH